MIGSVAAPRIYVDSNVFIYAIEAQVEIAESLRQLMNVFRSRPGLAVTSELTLAEVLVKANAQHRRSYLDLIVESGVFELCTVNRDLLIETATYRRLTGTTKLADAVHIVTALQSGCMRLLSADLRLKLPEGISLIDTTTDAIALLINELS